MTAKPHDPAPAPVYIEHDGHRTMLKWHRGRRRAGDPAFTATRIVEGMRAGASVEVDLLLHADRGFAILHDRLVDGATSGSGDVSTLRADEIRRLFLRDNHGGILDEPVLLLEDLPELFDGIDIAPDALLQLDFKENDAALDDAAVEVFARSVAPYARHFILSCGDAAAVARLTEAVPGIRIGYDPCHFDAAEAAMRSRDYDAFVARALEASPDAEMIYLENRLVLTADRHGHDLIGAFHAAGRRVDGYTVTGVGPHTVPAIKRLVELRVDQITTDDPEGLAALDLEAPAPGMWSRLVGWLRR